MRAGWGDVAIMLQVTDHAIWLECSISCRVRLCQGLEMHAGCGHERYNTKTAAEPWLQRCCFSEEVSPGCDVPSVIMTFLSRNDQHS